MQANESLVRKLNITIPSAEIADVIIAGFNAINGTSYTKADFEVGEGDVVKVTAHYKQNADALWTAGAYDELRLGQTDNEDTTQAVV